MGTVISDTGPLVIGSVACGTVGHCLACFQSLRVRSLENFHVILVPVHVLLSLAIPSLLLIENFDRRKKVKVILIWKGHERF